MPERCQDCGEDREQEEMATCVVCGCDVCRWCMDTRVCHTCLEDEGDSP